PPVLERLRGAGAWVEDVRLEPLNVEQVRHLVGDTLPGADDTVVTPLAALMHQKTGGNPFFLLRLLVTLHQDGLLVRLPGGGWRWDVEGARRKDYSENVVDFMVGRLRQFPERTQHLLSLAACVGNVFPLQTLGCLSALPEPGDVERELEPVLQEGLLARLGPERCRFLHDRIQQAAHSLMSDTEREQVHLRLGRLMLERLSPEELRESLFEAVSQFNAGLKWMEEPGERHQLARLNAEAGFKAQAAFALRPALTYFETAFTLIPGDPWETDYPLAFSLRLAQARTALMSGEAADAHRRVEALLPRARPRADTVAVYMVQQDIELATHDASKSMNTLLECLELLGMPVSPHPTWEEAVAAHEEVWTLLGGRSIESLIDLPLMTDPEMKMAIAALFRLNTGAYATDDNLLIIILSRIVSLTLRHGFVEDAARGCAWFGITTGWFFKNYRKGFTFAQLAHRLLEKHHLPTHKGGVLLGLQYCGYWTQPLTRALELAATGLAQARQSGDVAIASYSSISLVTNRLALGHPLDEVHHEALVSAAYLKQTGGIQDPPELLLGFQRYVEQLRGHTTSFQTLNGEGFDEAVFERHLPERLGSTQGHYWTVKLQSRFMCGAYEEARDAANRMNAWMWAQCGSLILREGRFFHALTLAACFTRDTPEQQRQTLEILARNHQQFAEWAELCPENFRAMERILFAERARIEGRGEEASCAFEEAIRVAGANGALHHQALASERAADFWRTRQTPIIAQSFAREAWKAYQQWGAPAKARHLESQWPHLATLESSRNGTNSVDTDSSSIDALTVIKAQQAISSEIVLERLVTALLRVALENAGAQRGALLLSEEDTLSVAALFQTALDGTLEEDRSRPPELPWTLLGYVRRAREHVLIGNTARPHAFLTDAYLSRGVARSVLCLPLLRGEQLSGVLYLENALATHAFSPARLGLLGHIASQAAISMENARLYADVQRARAELGQANDGLERRVEERTHELKRAQARLVDTAREVGMAEVASDVLHNVGNVLTSAVINLSLMREAVAAPRVNRLKQLAALFREQAGGLEDFLANDARGGYLPEYLDALGDELLREQQGLSVDMEEMNQHLEQIRAIVQVQQRYAKNTLMTEECDL
ncbi:MAG: GAF domain-containing protein, partial [Cystobacter sp.]